MVFDSANNFGHNSGDSPMKKWIQHAVKKKNALREYVRRHYGEKGFTERGTIKVEVLRELAERKGKVGQRARLALTLRKLRR